MCCWCPSAAARLSGLGDDLERAARAALRRHGRRRRRVLGGASALAILLPGGALAASLLTTEDVARSLPAGTKFLVGTSPTCEVVKDGVEYPCTISGPLNNPEVSHMKGTVEPTVDASKR